MERLKPDTVTGNSDKLSVEQRNNSEFVQALIATRARNKPKEKFDNLMHHLTFERVRECLSRISLKSAPGIDGMAVNQALEGLDWLLPPQLDAIHKGRYQAPSVRRVYIPKGNGGERPIGIPTVLDRAIQAGMTQILSAIYEQEFLPCSFGFRPGIGCHHALATVSKLLHTWKMNFALEVDIRDFFGSLNHDWLRKFLGLRIGDKRVLKLIDGWLAAGIMENGKIKEMSDGTPQGGSISPLLSNIYLHYVLDLWFERKVKRRLKGKAHLVRYCDDFVILFQEKQDMESFHRLLTARLAQFGLDIANEKTHQTNLTPRLNIGERSRRRITFLGFSIFRSKNRAGNGLKTVFKTEGKRYTQAKSKVKKKLSEIRHFDVKYQAKIVNALLLGHFNYYGIAGNTKRINHFWHFVKCQWRRTLSQRSQKAKMSWKEMNKIFRQYSLVTPRLCIPYKDLASFVRL